MNIIKNCFLLMGFALCQTQAMESNPLDIFKKDFPTLSTQEIAGIWSEKGNDYQEAYSRLENLHNSRILAQAHGTSDNFSQMFNSSLNRKDHYTVLNKVEELRKEFFDRMLKPNAVDEIKEFFYKNYCHLQNTDTLIEFQDRIPLPNNALFTINQLIDVIKGDLQTLQTNRDNLTYKISHMEDLDISMMDEISLMDGFILENKNILSILGSIRIYIEGDIEINAIMGKPLTSTHI